MQSASQLKESVVLMTSLWDPPKAPNIPLVQDHCWMEGTEIFSFKNLGDPDATVKSGREFALEENGFMKPFKYLRIRAIKCMIYDF